MTDPLGNVTQYFYDGQHHRIKTIDPLGHVTLQTFDVNGRLASVTNAEGLMLDDLCIGPKIHCVRQESSILTSLLSKGVRKMFRVMQVSLITIILGLGSSVRAHPGHDYSDGKLQGVRIWRDADGLFELAASFVLARDHQVLLDKPDGSRLWLPLDRLSVTDQTWVRKRVQKLRALNDGLHNVTLTPTRSQGHGPPRAFVASGVFMAVLVIAVLAWRARQQRFAAPCAFLVATPLCLLAACSSRPEAEIPEEQGADQGEPPAILADFRPFKDKLTFHWTANYLFIESNGLPDHPMMIGITNWQQQVPLPQPYTGKNAWQIPLKPKLAAKPISAKNALYRGAIALAVNGVPIFNALNNRGEDAFLIGELDEFGGHCGKGDDYHYHIAPLHLEKSVGQGKPLAYALDGFPLFGLTNEKLDEFNGRFDKDGNYRYHATKTYPYINGGMRGVVEVRGDQVDPQPHAGPVRPEGRPLKGAKITGFTVDDEQKNFSLKYQVQGETRMINYKVNPNGSVTFVFVDGTGNEHTETYTRREGKGKKDDKKGDDKKKKKGPAD